MNENNLCPNNFQSERQHKWGWCSVTSFKGGRSGTYAKCAYCEAEDWALLEHLIAQMLPPEFNHGDTVIYRDEHWRWDITGSVRLDLVKVTEYEAIVQDSYVNPSLFGKFDEPLERRYSILCKDGNRLFERSPTGEFLTRSDHGGTITAWRAAEPKPKPYKLEDNDPALTNPRLRCIGITFEKERDEPFRCGKCGHMRKGAMAYVSDGWEFSRPTWREMVERYQRFWNGNGHRTGWCVGCTMCLLPETSKEYLKYELTGAYPVRVYMQSTCDTCGQSLAGKKYHYRSIGEDKWEVYCHECHYAAHSEDMYGGGFSCTLGSSSSHVGMLAAGQSVSVGL